jgi:hypothetical protein
MNSEEGKIKIRFEDGSIRTLKPVAPKIEELREYFQSYTGVNFNSNEWIYLLVVKALKRWLNINGFHHPAAAGLIVAAEGIVASAQAKQSDGFIAFAEEDEECLLVCPDPCDPYVHRISKMVYNDITGRRISVKKLIVNVEFLNLRNGNNVEDLMYQLDLAIEAEEFEQAAKLRDRITLLQNPK